MAEKKKNKVRGVPGPKKTRSGSPLQSSSKTRKDLRSDPSRATAQANGINLGQWTYDNPSIFEVALWDRLDRIEAQARTNHEDIVAQIEKRFARLTAPEPKEEPWIPKVGDWVVCDERHVKGSLIWNTAMDAFIGVPMRVQDNVRTYCVSADKGWLWHHDWLRPATEIELSRYLQEKEWAKETELKSGDACDTNAGEQAELFKLWGSDVGVGGGGGTRTWYYRTKQHEDLCTLSLAPGQEKGSDIKRWLPFDVFRRLEQGTIARIKREREEKEAAMPIKRGTKVMHNGQEHFVCIDKPAADGEWLLTNEGANDAWWVPRSEFSIIQ